jgi:hypothetical protein
MAPYNIQQLELVGNLGQTSMLLLLFCAPKSSTKPFVKYTGKKIKTMKIIHLILAISLLSLVGCLKESETANRYDSYHENPVVFEVHDLKVDGEDITAALRSQDERIKGKTLYLDSMIDVFSGETKITESSEFFYLTDGIGKIDTILWIPSEDKKKINPNKGIEIKIRILGWGEMFPGVVQQK